MRNLLFQRRLNNLNTPVNFVCRCILYSLYLFLLIVCASCNLEGYKIQKLVEVDSLVLDLNNNGHLQYSVIKENNKDSAILIFDGENKKAYTINFTNKRLSNLELPVTIGSSARTMTIVNNKLYVLCNDDKTIIVYDLGLNILNKYKLGGNQNESYYNLFIPLKFNNDAQSILHKIPNCNIQNTEERNKYFQSKLLAKISIQNKAIHEEHLDITFPTKFINSFFYDLYPIVDYNNNLDTFIFTFKHCDSIFIKSKNLISVHIPILQTSQAPAFPDSLISSYSYANEYETTYPMNYRLLFNNNNILLFTKKKVTLLNEIDELNTFESSPKQILNYNLKLNKFTNIYSIPQNYESRSSFIFNNYLVTPNLDNSKNLILYVAKF